MAKLSSKSLAQLATCHPDLQRLIHEAVLQFPLVVLEGKRSLERQTQLVADGKSKTLASLHLTDPARAVDLAPYFDTEPHIRWDDREMFHMMGGYLLGIASKLGIHARWGGDWQQAFSNRPVKRFDDLPHLELI